MANCKRVKRAVIDREIFTSQMKGKYFSFLIYTELQQAHKRDKLKFRQTI